MPDICVAPGTIHSALIGKCLFRPELRGTEQPLQNHSGLVNVAFVEAAPFLGGQTLVS